MPRTGHARRKGFLRRLGTFGVVHRFRAAGQNDGLRRKTLDLLPVDIAGVDFRIHTEFAHAARDQLGVLGAEIENENSVRVNVGHQPIR